MKARRARPTRLIGKDGKMRHDWPKWWADREQAMLTVDWDKFRRDMFLLGGLQANHSKLPVFWAMCEKHNVPMKTREGTRIGAPKGEMKDGMFVTSTSLKMAYHFHRIMKHWEAPEAPRVLEIGGGIGGMARTVVLHLPGVRRYTLVDHPLCLRIQRHFLGKVFPDRGGLFDFVPNDRISYLFGQRFDLVINTHSFNEMTKEIVADYFRLIQDVLVPGGALYTYGRNRYPDGSPYTVNVPTAEFPFDDRWRFELPRTDNRWVEILAVRR